MPSTLAKRSTLQRLSDDVYGGRIKSSSWETKRHETCHLQFAIILNMDTNVDKPQVILLNFAKNSTEYSVHQPEAVIFVTYPPRHINHSNYYIRDSHIHYEIVHSCSQGFISVECSYNSAKFPSSEKVISKKTVAIWKFVVGHDPCTSASRSMERVVCEVWKVTALVQFGHCIKDNLKGSTAWIRN